MTGEVIQTVGNKHTLVDVKGRGNPLREHVRDIVVGVGPVIEFRAERALPFLRGDFVARIGSMENETLELQLTDGRNLGPDLESQISIRFVGIGSFNETNLRVEIGPSFSSFDDSI